MMRQKRTMCVYSIVSCFIYHKCALTKVFSNLKVFQRNEIPVLTSHLTTPNCVCRQDLPPFLKIWCCSIGAIIRMKTRVFLVLHKLARQPQVLHFQNKNIFLLQLSNLLRTLLNQLLVWLHLESSENGKSSVWHHRNRRKDSKSSEGTFAEGAAAAAQVVSKVASTCSEVLETGEEEAKKLATISFVVCENVEIAATVLECSAVLCISTGIQQTSSSNKRFSLGFRIYFQ